MNVVLPVVAALEAETKARRSQPAGARSEPAGQARGVRRRARARASAVEAFIQYNRTLEQISQRAADAEARLAANVAEAGARRAPA
ncbi:MAG: hypothetical protein M5R40_06600 [Anaerolineae bacterium]|nr:hypothetical protein [Anaerolineae bacterium]